MVAVATGGRFSRDGVEVAGAFGLAPIECFCNTHPCGKRRRIDNELKGVQNEHTRYCERLSMVNASQTAVDGRLIVAALDAQYGPKHWPAMGLRGRR